MPMKKTLYVIILLLIGFILALNITSAFHLSLFGFRTFTVSSGSMEPYLEIRDLIIIKSSKNYQVGDVVTYIDENNQYVTHRIIEINGNTVIAQGDANNTQDEPINSKDIIGKLVFKSSFFKIFTYFQNNPVFWVLLFVIGILVIYLIPDKEEETAK